ncbi:MAG: nucleotide sugar dehydrogenase [Planctomycetes bacterium]|nr:nucleotide sugar dehydrogenase [Planctomycetota bacterium]
MKIAVIGTGYVGLVTGTGLASLGHTVVCVDVVQERVDRINRAQPPFFEEGLEAMLAEQVRAGRLSATTEHREALEGAEASIIAVGTPMIGEDDRRQDPVYLVSAAEAIGAYLKTAEHYHVVTVKSTVVPGTTGGIVREALERAAGKPVGSFGLCMNPEFLREGSAVQDFNEPDRIVIGQHDPASGDVLERMYAKFDCPKVRTGLVNAELIKYASNSLLATLISFSNQIAAVCESVPEADAAAVLRGVHLDRRFSPVIDGRRVSPGMLTYLEAGPGYGGSCFPKDVNALRLFASDHGIESAMLDATVAINDGRTDQMVRLLRAELGELAGKTIAVLGLAFKPGTDDLRESPGLKLMKALEAEGCATRGVDPLAWREAAGREGVAGSTHGDVAEAVAEADGAVIVTSWPQFKTLDWAALAGTMNRPVIFDTRQVLAGVALPAAVRVFGVGQGNLARQAEAAGVRP